MKKGLLDHIRVVQTGLPEKEDLGWGCEKGEGGSWAREVGVGVWRDDSVVTL